MPNLTAAAAGTETATPGSHGAWMVRYEIGGQQLTDYWFYVHRRWVFDLVLSNPDAVPPVPDVPAAVCGSRGLLALNHSPGRHQDLRWVAPRSGRAEMDVAGPGRAQDGERPAVVGAALRRVEPFTGARVSAAETG